MAISDTVGWFKLELLQGQNANLQVSSVQGREALGEPYVFDIDLVTDKFDLDFKKIVGSPAELRISPAGANTTSYHGLITRIEALFEVVEGKMLIRARLEPAVARLRDSVYNECFIDDAEGYTLPKLLDAVLKRNGLQSGKDYELKLNQSILKRPFIMQYQESHLDFVHRWLEWEGAYYYFEQDEKRERIVFVDENASLPARNINLKYRPVGMAEVNLYQFGLQSFSEAQRVVASKSILQDYNYRQASDPVKAEEVVGSDTWGEVMAFGGDLRQNNHAEHYAQLRAEAQSVRATLVRGRGTASGLTAGTTVSILGHPRQSMNGDYRVIAIRHTGTQSGFGLAINPEKPELQGENFYTAEFEAIPISVPFRLDLRTPRPRITGYLPGFIDAEGDGAAAQVDRYGRYKVDFPFDFTPHGAAKSSAWVRLATPYGGPGVSNQTGLHFPLLKGAEVMLSFMDGDPDQPCIVGVLPNSLTPTPVNDNNHGLNRIVSTSSNELHLEDTPGLEGVRMRSSNGSAMFVLGAFGGRFGNLPTDPMDDDMLS